MLHHIMKAFLILVLILTSSVYSLAGIIEDVRSVNVKDTTQLNQLIVEVVDFLETKAFAALPNAEQAELLLFTIIEKRNQNVKISAPLTEKLDSIYPIDNDIIGLNIMYLKVFVQYNQAKYQDALEISNQALKILQDINDIPHPNKTLQTKKYLQKSFMVLNCVLYRRLGEYNKAIAVVEEALPLFGKDSDEDKYDYARLMHNYTNLLSSQGRYAKVIPLRRELILLCRQIGRDGAANTGEFMLANDLIGSNQLAAAEQILHPYFTNEKSYERQGISNIHILMMKIKIKQKKYDEARHYFNEGLERYTKSGYKNKVGYIYSLAADLYSDLNQRDSTRIVLDSAKYYLDLVQEKTPLNILDVREYRFHEQYGLLDNISLKRIDSSIAFAEDNNLFENLSDLYKHKRNKLIQLKQYNDLPSINAKIDSLHEKVLRNTQINHSDYVESLNKEIELKQNNIALLSKQERDKTYVFVAIISFLLVIFFLLSLLYYNRQKAIQKEAALKEQIILYYKSISHDIKFPLNNIRQLLNDTGLNSFNNQQLLSDVQHTVEKLIQLFEIEDVELDKRIVEWEKTALRVARQLKVENNIVIESSKQKTVYADPFLLQQVFINLIHNASKHMDSNDGKIHLSVQPKAAYTEIQVADNGEGLPTEIDDVNAIFKINHTSANNNPTYSKRGIGLYIVQKVMEKHKGFARIGKNKGDFKGLNICLSFPKLEN